jgi:hypothetical protein
VKEPHRTRTRLLNSTPQISGYDSVTSDVPAMLSDSCNVAHTHHTIAEMMKMPPSHQFQALASEIL